MRRAWALRASGTSGRSLPCRRRGAQVRPRSRSQAARPAGASPCCCHSPASSKPPAWQCATVSRPVVRRVLGRHPTAGRCLRYGRPGAAAAYQRALAEGARVVVGPLTKEDIVAVVAAQPAGLAVPTLALNTVTTSGVAPPAFLYQFALDPEQEARAVARRIATDGLVRGVALFPDNAWGQRVHDAFIQELQATGAVTLLSAQYYDAGRVGFLRSITRSARPLWRRRRSPREIQPTAGLA